MGTRLRLWWKKPGRHTKAIVLIVLIGVFVLLFGGYLLDWGWTGFKGKTFWDFLGVLAVPIVVGLGAAWYSAQQGKVSDRENTDNQREAALQEYIDKMSELLLEKNLRGSSENDEVRTIARVRTLTALPRLDGERKRSVLQFLYESGLIDRGKPVVDLNGADLSYINFQWAKLPNADLRRANLQKANLWFADLREADLSHANLQEAILNAAILEGTILRNAQLSETDLSGTVMRGADLRDANLYGTDLRGADLLDVKGVQAITIEELEKKVGSLKYATMPDGSRHP